MLSMIRPLTPVQQQAWDAVLVAVGQPALATFKQALREARPVLSNPRSLTMDQRTQLWHVALTHPDVAWPRATLKSYPMELRGSVMATTPLETWNRPHWLGELWSLVTPTAMIRSIVQAGAPDHLPAVSRLFSPDALARRHTEGWASDLLLKAIVAQDVERMRNVWAWSTPTDEHWREVVNHADAPMLEWFSSVLRRQEHAALPLKQWAVDACRAKGEAAARVFEWCVPLLRRHHKGAAYLSLFESWITASVDTPQDRWLEALDRHVPDHLSARVMAKLCQAGQQAHLARWLPGRAPPLDQVITDLNASLSATSPTWWKVVDQIGEVWPTPGDLEAWVHTNSAQLPRTTAQFRTFTATRPSVPAPGPRHRPRRRV